MGLRDWKLREAARVLRRGGVVAYPTEAVFGLGCDPFAPLAVSRLLALKGRKAAKGLILVGAAADQFRGLLAAADADLEARLESDRPRPTTWLVAARADVPPWLTGASDRVAVRVTRHPIAAALCRAFGGPVVSTSANRAGRRPARTGREARLRLGPAVDLVVHGPCGGFDRVSEIRDAATGRVVRS